MGDDIDPVSGNITTFSFYVQAANMVNVVNNITPLDIFLFVIYFPVS